MYFIPLVFLLCGALQLHILGSLLCRSRGIRMSLQHDNNQKKPQNDVFGNFAFIIYIQKSAKCWKSFKISSFLSILFSIIINGWHYHNKCYLITVSHTTYIIMWTKHRDPSVLREMYRRTGWKQRKLLHADINITVLLQIM